MKMVFPKIMTRKILIPMISKFRLGMLLIIAFRISGFMAMRLLRRLMIRKMQMILLKAITAISLYFIVVRNLSYSLESLVMTRAVIRLYQ